MYISQDELVQWLAGLMLAGLGYDGITSQVFVSSLDMYGFVMAMTGLGLTQVIKTRSVFPIILLIVGLILFVGVGILWPFFNTM